MSFTPKQTKLLDGATAAGASGQYAIGQLEDVTLHLFGFSTGGVTVYLSNESGGPTDANRVAHGTEHTADAVVSDIPEGVGYIEVEVSTLDDGGNGGITAILRGRNP